MLSAQRTTLLCLFFPLLMASFCFRFLILKILLKRFADYGGLLFPWWWRVQWQSIISRDHTPPPPAASCSPDKGNIFHSMRQILLRKQTNLILILQNYFMLLDKYYVLESGHQVTPARPYAYQPHQTGNMFCF